jgi:hypothetical protein
MKKSIRSESNSSNFLSGFNSLLFHLQLAYQACHQTHSFLERNRFLVLLEIDVQVVFQQRILSFDCARFLIKELNRARSLGQIFLRRK